MSYRPSVTALLLSFVVLSLPVSGCYSRRTVEGDCKQAAEARRVLLSELKSIHSIRDARAREARLRDCFSRLAELMIAIDRRRKKRVAPVRQLSREEQESSGQVQEELQRVLAIPGTEAVLRRAQEEGFRQLEKYIWTTNSELTEGGTNASNDFADNRQQ